jgi:hypothetical protein
MFMKLSPDQPQILMYKVDLYLISLTSQAKKVSRAFAKLSDLWENELKF